MGKHTARTAEIKIIEELQPRGGALPARTHDGQPYLLTVTAHTDGRRNQNVRGILVDAGLDHGAIENDANNILIDETAGASLVRVDLHLAPAMADHILADDALEQPDQSPLDVPGVDAGEVGLDLIYDGSALAQIHNDVIDSILGITARAA